MESNAGERERLTSKALIKVPHRPETETMLKSEGLSNPERIEMITLNRTSYSDKAEYSSPPTDIERRIRQQLGDTSRQLAEKDCAIIFWLVPNPIPSNPLPNPERIVRMTLNRTRASIKQSAFITKLT
jgi:hypothetical protein